MTPASSPAPIRGRGTSPGPPPAPPAPPVWGHERKLSGSHLFANFLAPPPGALHPLGPDRQAWLHDAAQSIYRAIGRKADLPAPLWGVAVEAKVPETRDIGSMIEPIHGLLVATGVVTDPGLIESGEYTRCRHDSDLLLPPGHVHLSVYSLGRRPRRE